MLGKFFKILTLAGGLGLFVWLLADVDLEAVGHELAAVGALGLAAIMFTFAVGFAADIASWLLMFRTIAVTRLWAWRLALVHLVGEALNVVTPFGSLGGEPFKALLLKRHYDVSYREGTASLLLIQTVNSLAMVPFVLIGAIITVQRDLLAPAVETAVMGAALVIMAFMLAVYALLHMRALAAFQRWLEGSRWSAQFGRGLAAMRDIEEHLFHFVRATPGRSFASLVFAFVTWFAGAVEMYLIFLFLGHPISLTDAWMVEAAIVLVRAGTFFIPGHLGVQDGAIALLGQALGGSAELGLAVALLRRGRELVWTAAGLAVGAWYGLQDTPGDPPVTA